MNVATETTPKVFRFLIVDDSRAIQAIIRRVVEACGYPALDIRVAINGEAAMDALADFKPDLVITDWHMPKMSGLELLQALRQLGQGHLKVGLVTTETSPTMLEEARRNGAVFVINKPFKDTDLIAHVRHVVPVDGQAPAPEQTPEEAAAAASLVITQQCKDLIQSVMNGIPFRLLEEEPLVAHALTSQNLIGLYGGRSKPVTAIAVLDTNAVCILGGGSSRQPPAAVRQAMQQGQATESMVKHASQFMQSAGALLRIEAEKEPIPLSRTSIVPQSFQKLNELLVKNGGRADFRISVPGYGDGRFSFLAV
ncbi:response regulator [Aquabacterium sp.]|uniref:response regulator n=1 Tax=Aquabacterium sp. TaxID=1872578 RepID=UPI0025B90D37|nr:response regulator [Aquabacterium sp.]MBI3381339.1 response regulator [Aquabacterium sp.]